MCIPVDETIPDESAFKNQAQKDAFNKALQYMNFHPAEKMLDRPVDVIFIGSCTNGRLSDLKEAAEIFKGNKKASNITAIVVPGSQQVKKQAENLGLDQIFKAAGAEWREPGCSMCIGMNGDQVKPGHYAISTSNRNFEGRQGKNARTLLASPATAAASALTGKVTDPREIIARTQP
jgi:3-isopropylmalate/(R)-2-methylmalate dehydratase large subunit